MTSTNQEIIIENNVKTVETPQKTENPAAIVDFGELSRDDGFKERISKLQSSFSEIKTVIDTLIDLNMYDKLPLADQVRYDLFLAFTINSLYWMYLRTQGKDPNQEDVKNEIARVREYMTKSNKLYEKNHLMPRIDKGAAARFVRSGLFDPTTKKPEVESTADSPQEEPAQSTSGKRKREQDSDDE